MLNPIESVLFHSTFSLGNKKFRDKELILSLLFHRETIIQQYFPFRNVLS